MAAEDRAADEAPVAVTEAVVAAEEAAEEVALAEEDALEGRGGRVIPMAEHWAAPNATAALSSAAVQVRIWHWQRGNGRNEQRALQARNGVRLTARKAAW